MTPAWNLASRAFVAPFVIRHSSFNRSGHLNAHAIEFLRGHIGIAEGAQAAVAWNLCLARHVRPLCPRRVAQRQARRIGQRVLSIRRTGERDGPRWTLGETSDAEPRESVGGIGVREPFVEGVWASPSGFPVATPGSMGLRPWLCVQPSGMPSPLESAVARRNS